MAAVWGFVPHTLPVTRCMSAAVLPFPRAAIYQRWEWGRAGDRIGLEGVPLAGATYPRTDYSLAGRSGASAAFQSQPISLARPPSQPPS